MSFKVTVEDGYALLPLESTASSRVAKLRDVAAGGANDCFALVWNSETSQWVGVELGAVAEPHEWTMPAP